MTCPRLFAQDDPPGGGIRHGLENGGIAKRAVGARGKSRSRCNYRGRRFATVPSADRIPGKVSLYYIVTEDYIYIRTLNKQKKNEGYERGVV